MTESAWRSVVDPLIAVGGPPGTSDSIRPYYRVIAVTADRAWIRDIRHGTDHILPVDQFPGMKDGRS